MIHYLKVVDFIGGKEVSDDLLILTKDQIYSCPFSADMKPCVWLPGVLRVYMF